MTALIIILCIVLISVIVVQIGRVTELAAKIRGEEEVQYQSNNRHGLLSLLFLIGLLVLSIGSAWYYKNYMLGYGPHEAASAHGSALDYIRHHANRPVLVCLQVPLHEDVQSAVHFAQQPPGGGLDTDSGRRYDLPGGKWPGCLERSNGRCANRSRGR